jgi:cytochrome c6
MGWEEKMAKRTHWLNATRMSVLLLVGFCLWGAPLRADTPGESLYKAKCVSCHGADGKGETPVGKMYKLRDLGSADVQKQSDDELASIISKGKNKMPGYGRSLKEDQIKDLVTYIRSLTKK